MGSDSWVEQPPKAFSLRRGSAVGGGEARNPPLPVADTGGCSANEATSFASVSAAKRLCRIVRIVGYEVAVRKVFIKDNATAADYAPHQSALADSFSSRRSLVLSAVPSPDIPFTLHETIVSRETLW